MTSWTFGEFGNLFLQQILNPYCEPVTAAGAGDASVDGMDPISAVVELAVGCGQVMPAGGGPRC